MHKRMKTILGGIGILYRGYFKKLKVKERQDLYDAYIKESRRERE